MKLHLYLLAMLFLLIQEISTTIFYPELVVVIMVKNEEDVLIKTLEPFVQAGVAGFLVYDTGSTDKTVQQISDYFEQHANSVTGYVVQEPFIDFAASRNRALQLAAEYFPQAGFMMMPDAEWYIQNASELVDFCKRELAGEQIDDSYLVRLIMGNTDFYQPRLIRMHSPTQFVGVVHETLNHVSHKKVPDNILFLVQPSSQGAEKSRQRWHRDRDLLLKEYEKNPHDPRTVFYLAQTYDCLGDWMNASTFYNLRTKINGWHEENYMAHYRLAQVLENHLDQWEKALHHYIKAFTICPQRAEPLVRIAQHYWSTQEIAPCYLFAKYASELKYPKQDRLFVEKDVYEWLRFHVLSCAAWQMQQFEIGYKAAKRALKKGPALEQLQKNVEYFAQVVK